MTKSNTARHPSRRQFLQTLAAGSATAAIMTTVPNMMPGVVTGRAQAASPANLRNLVAAPSSANLIPGGAIQTPVWTFNGSVPGTLLRVKQGEDVNVAFENRLDEPSSIHWHGVRLPNAMDGVPGLTQKPVAPGETFEYRFTARDAGTYWYHPHINAPTQLARGMYGALIVEEDDPISVDREFVWLIDDWRLGANGEIDPTFNGGHDVGHAGRLGELVTVNSVHNPDIAVRPGERIRVRMINTANARIFAIDFAGLAPHLIALDGHPITPHVPDEPVFLFAPGTRADFVIDVPVDATGGFALLDRFFDGLENPLVNLRVQGDRMRDEISTARMALSANPLPEPDLQNARREQLLYTGGMMGGGVLRHLVETGKIDQGFLGGVRSMAQSMMGMMTGGGVWMVNGRDPERDDNGPLFDLKAGESCVFTLTNATAWYHPIHLHGHAFRVISRDGTPTRYQEWQDTVLIAPAEQVEIAFVADNPGDWMLHCHILEHKFGGMSGFVRVA
ncbi:MAG: multicopper oxidase family protein [Thalassospira sp.]|uniref:multicopper oxidase family protein n=1 Tax=Thalassospira sp. TaxID=1912094 RepID=UPI003A84AC5B